MPTRHIFAVLAALTLVGAGCSPATTAVSEPAVPQPAAPSSVPESVPVPAAAPAAAPGAQPAAAPWKGKLLAGDERLPLLDFTKEDYERALRERSYVILYYYADWCSVCRKEFPEMQRAFADLAEKGVLEDGWIGFRVNFNDDFTDADEKGLAREFGVAYQHTKVILRDGKRVHKSPESWTFDDYHEALQTLTFLGGE
jgi:thiol-disulfide isomerase/thioredoxin